jgi:membrane-bound lytic murein transglycosylase B
MAGTGIRSGAALLVALAALAAAGCGGSSSSDTTATDTWASGVCTAVSTWKTSLTGIATTVKSGGVSQDSLNSAATQAQDATKTLADSLKKLGKPDTQAGQQAKDAVDQLSSELSKNVKTIQDAISNASGAAGVLTAVSTASSTLVTMGDEVSATLTDLQKLDPKGEIQQAFKQSSSCKSLLGT